jgi:hypothetical protein
VKNPHPKRLSKPKLPKESLQRNSSPHLGLKIVQKLEKLLLPNDIHFASIITNPRRQSAKIYTDTAILNHSHSRCGKNPVFRYWVSTSLFVSTMLTLGL